MDIEFIQYPQIINNDERMYEIAKHEIEVSKFFNRKLQEYRHNLDIKN